MPGQLYVLAGLWGQSQLWLHVIRQLRLGITLLFPVDDARLLGEFVPAGAENGRSVAHALLYRHHLPRLFLFTQSYLGYCRHVVRRVAEKGRRRGRSSSFRGGSHQGESLLPQVPLLLLSNTTTADNIISLYCAFFLILM